MNLKNCSKGFNAASGTVALEKRWKMGYSLTPEYYRQLCNIGTTLLHFPEPYKLV